jgi:excisionase family DNA binding protein
MLRKVYNILVREENLLTTGETVKIHSVTPDTALIWIKFGKLQAPRAAGGHYRVNPAELRRFIAAD